MCLYVCVRVCRLCVIVGCAFRCCVFLVFRCCFDMRVLWRYEFVKWLLCTSVYALNCYAMPCCPSLGVVLYCVSVPRFVVTCGCCVITVFTCVFHGDPR